MSKPTVLASDMDGTFIPLEGNEDNLRDLSLLASELQRLDTELVYVTGRHFELALDAIDQHGLPLPSHLICDVGTSVYEHGGDGQFAPSREYVDHLEAKVVQLSIAALRERLVSVAAINLQDAEKQGKFKLSYECDTESLNDVTEGIEQILTASDAPWQVVASVDPFTGIGLIDLLPRGVTKAYAMRWWVQQQGRDDEHVMFAGDSGNDLAALTAGFRSIVVRNASSPVRDQVAAAHREAGWEDRLFLATKPATSGVLEGLRHFAQP